MKHLTEFLKRYISDWLTILCGLLALPLTAYGIYASGSNHDRLFFTALLVFCLIVSSFRVWKKEYLRSLQAEFPRIGFPGGATEFAVVRGDRIEAEYVAVHDLTVTNVDGDKPVTLQMYVQIRRGPTHLMFSPENEAIPNWRELAHLQDVPNSAQLTFPLTVQPRTSVGGHAIFLMARNLRYGWVDDGAARDEWFIYLENLIGGEKQVIPINVVDRRRVDGGCEIVYAGQF